MQYALPFNPRSSRTQNDALIKKLVTNDWCIPLVADDPTEQPLLEEQLITTIEYVL